MSLEESFFVCIDEKATMAKIASFMKQNNLTCRSIARRMNVDERSVRNWIAGRVEFRVVNLIGLMEIFGVSMINDLIVYRLIPK